MSVGNCVTSIGFDAIQTGKPLDAGLAFNVVGPQRSNVLLNRKVLADRTNYEASIPQSFVPATGGDFTFDNFPGGTDVKFISTGQSLPSNFTWTNSAALANVDRQGATVTWSGGTITDEQNLATYVEITGSVTVSGVPVTFHCRAASSAGRFTIPSSALMAIPPGGGFLELTAVSQKAYDPPGLDFLSQVGRVSLTVQARY